eukprot:scaffold8177_cov484-Prasinococcus_capsulatus_cf.AAC.1
MASSQGPTPLQREANERHGLLHRNYILKYLGNDTSCQQIPAGDWFDYTYCVQGTVNLQQRSGTKQTGGLNRERHLRLSACMDRADKGEDIVEANLQYILSNIKQLFHVVAPLERLGEALVLFREAAIRGDEKNLATRWPLP